MRPTVFQIALISLFSLTVNGQNAPVIVEAETGTLGADLETVTEGDVDFITPQTDFINSGNPGSADKVASFTVNFTDSGTYKLFARVRVGSEGADDDSFFHGNGFGTKDPVTDNDWIVCNNMSVAGFTILDDVVEGQGDAASETWKWIALSDYTGFEDPITFRIELGDLTKTFEIGARENGFDIDKIAFGREGLYYTVDNLDKGEAGSEYPPGEEPVGPPLASGLDKFLGCGYGPDSQRDFAGYWNQVTPGNAGKWGWVEGTRDNMSWTDLDAAYQVAMDSDFVFKHHVLVWGAQQPAWVADLDSAEQRAELEEWFAAVAARYPGIDQVEVVNEPLHQPPDTLHEGGYIGALGGSGVTGWDWILEAFRMARAAFTDTTVLVINEYNIMNSTDNTDTYMEIIELLQAEDTLINAIGFQAHGFSHNASNETILRNLDTLASTGLPLYVTELDIDGLTDRQQVHGYMNLFPLFWKHPAIQGITLWGFRPGMWRGDQGAYLIDEFGNERPAMLWLRAYLKNEFVPNESISVYTSSGETTIDTDNGTLQMLADVYPDTATLKTVYWQVSNTDIATIDEDGLLTAVTDGTITVYGRSLELGSDVSDQMEITVSGQVGTQSITGTGNIRLYPNPSENGRFILDGMEGITSVSVFDLNGNLIEVHDVTNQTDIELNLNVPSGIYIIRLVNDSRYYHTKITVQ
ncbi:MAG: endo-1,4-beta-xylanase [Bacteroidales bacterium]|jgi:endo-1,4-beta-xylanase